MKAFALLWVSFSYAPLYPTTSFAVILGSGLSRDSPLGPTSTYPLVIKGQWIW